MVSPQFTGLQTLAAGRALQLAAGGLGQGGRFEQGDDAGRFLLGVTDHPVDGFDQHLGVEFLLHTAPDLGGDADALATVDLHRERRDTPLAHRFDALLHGFFDVLRVTVLAANDDHVLGPRGDEQTALMQERQVTAAQPAAVGQVEESPGGGLGVAPVATGHAGAADPDFTHGIFSHRLQGLRVHQAHLIVEQQTAAADHFGAMRIGNHPAQGQLVVVHMQGVVRTATGVAGDHQGRFGQAVARVHGGRRQPCRGEALNEVGQGVGPYRFGTAKRNAPLAQVELGKQAVAHALGTQAEGKVRAAAEGTAVAVNRFQPARRPGKEVLGGQQHQRHTGIDRLQHAADQAHVVVQRQPADEYIPRAGAEAHLQQALIVQQVGVGDFDALGFGGGAGGVLQHGDGIARHRTRLPRPGRLRLKVLHAGHARQVCQGQAIAQQPGSVEGPMLAEDQRGLGVHGHALQAFGMELAVAFRRIGRHCNQTGIQAREKGHDVIRAVGQQQEHPVALPGVLPQTGSQVPDPGIQLRVGVQLGGLVAITEKAQGQLFALLLGALRQHLDQGVGLRLMWDGHGASSCNRKKSEKVGVTQRTSAP